MSAVEVKFQRSGRTLTWDGKDASLLDFAERHGIEVESGCRAGGCGSCETRLLEGAVRYEPATFDHDKYFVLDRDHEAPCETCHRNNDYSRYTCYGCHEHSQAKVRAQHIEEGIRDFENCVECHRDPRVEPQKGGGRERRGRERD